MEKASHLAGSMLAKISTIDDKVVENLRQWNFSRLIIQNNHAHHLDDLSGLFQPEIILKIRELFIRRTSIQDITSLYQLNQIEYLFLDDLKIVPKSTHFQFDAFPNLKRAKIYWDKMYQDIFMNQSIEDLELISFRGQFSQLATMKQLKSLHFFGGNVQNLQGISQFPMLENLVLRSMRSLQNIDDLADYLQLKHFSMGESGKVDISVLQKMHHLEYLALCKKYDFENFDFFADLSQLSTLILNGQVCQHNFDVLFRLPKLSHVLLVKQKSFDGNEQEIMNLAKQYGRQIELKIMGKKSPSIEISFQAA